MIIHNPILTGSFTVNGTDVASITSSAANLTALNAITASILSTTGSLNTASGSAITRLSSIEIVTGSNITRLNSIEIVTGSNITRLSSLEAKTGSYATTGSNTFIGTQTISGSILQSGSFTSTGTLTAQTLVVQTITSSVDFVTGSTRFGSLLANSHVFTGSMSVSGSITSQGGFILGNSATIAPTGSIGYNNAIGVFIYGKSGSEADFRLYNASGLTAMSVVAGTQNVSFNSSVAIGTTNLSARLNVQASANFENATLGTATGTMGYLSANGLYGMYVGIGNSGNTWLQSQRNDGTTAVYNLLLNPQGGNVGIGITDPSVTFNVGHSGHGIGIAYRGSSALPSIAGLFTSDGTGGGQTGYGSLLIKARTDYGGFYSLSFFTAASDNTPVERMRITSAGNVGIGSTSIVNANAKLEVKGDVFITPSGSASKLHLYNADSSNESYIYDAGGASSSVITLAPAGTTSLSVAATAVTIAAGRKLVINGDNYYQSSAQDLAFSSGIREIFRVSHVGLCTGGRFSIAGTGNSFVHSSQWAWSSTHNGGYGRAWLIQLTSGEYSNITMYVDTTSAGDVIISTNLGGAFTMNVFIEKTSGGSIDITSQNADRTSAASGYQRVQSTTSVSYGSQFYSVVAATLAGSGNRALYSDSAGLITNSSSDVTLKKNVENITYGLNSIMSLRPIAFNWIPENLGPQKEIGFIAQEVQESIPELIGTNRDETLSLDYPKLTAVLTKAIQELKAEFDAYKTTHP
jgi:hypothetical protein